MTDFNDNNRNNTPAAQPEPASEAVQPAAEPAPAPQTESSADTASPAGTAPEQTPPPAQPNPAENGGWQPPRYTQQYQPPYNEPQPPYQQPYASNPYGQQGYQTPYAAQKVYAQKSRIAAALLAILFGTFGVHNFYQGRIGVGIAQLAITVVSCGWLAVVSAVWGIIEGIQLLQGKKFVDGHDLPFID